MTETELDNWCGGVPIVTSFACKRLWAFRYYIPAYQRGYRWTPTQVTQLLDDMREFSVVAMANSTISFHRASSAMTKTWVLGGTSSAGGEIGDWRWIIWYMAWRDGQHSKFESMLWDGKHSRFTYGVRPSSTEFFDELVRYIPCITPDEVSSVRKLIEDQSSFFLHWRLDPTIQSVLVMLDAIHGIFKSRSGLFNRLVDDAQCGMPANTSCMAFGVVPSFCSSNTSPASSSMQFQLDRSPRSRPIVSSWFRKFLTLFPAAVLIFFIVGLLYLLCFEHVDKLGSVQHPVGDRAVRQVASALEIAAPTIYKYIQLARRHRATTKKAAGPEQRPKTVRPRADA